MKCEDCGLGMPEGTPYWKKRCADCYNSFRKKLSKKKCIKCNAEFTGESWKKLCIECFRKGKSPQKHSTEDDDDDMEVVKVRNEFLSLF